MLNKRTMEVVALDHRTVQVWYKTCVTIHSLIIMKDTLTSACPWGCAAVLWAACPAPPPTKVLPSSSRSLEFQLQLKPLLNTT